MFTQNRLAAAVASLTLAGAGALAAAPQAQAATVASTTRLIQNVQTGFCLDSNSNGRAYTNVCDIRNQYQTWTVAYTPNFSGYTVRNVATGLCLDSNTSGRAYTLSCNGGSYQMWEISIDAQNLRTFKNVATGLMLDSNTAKRVYTHPVNDGLYQKWR